MGLSARKDPLVRESSRICRQFLQEFSALSWLTRK